MGQRIIRVLFVFMLGIAEANALRCGNRLIKEGDHQFEVLKKCGEPLYRDHRTEFRAIKLKSPGLTQEQFVPVEIDEWIYDFGPNRFTRLLHFENSILIRIESLGNLRFR